MSTPATCRPRSTTATGGTFEALAINPAAATTAITDTINSTTVSLTATPSVAEGGTIVYTASLTSAAQSPVTVTLSNGATIIIASGSSSGSANVAAPGDDVYADAGSVSATINSASGGNFEALAINPAAATTSVTDTLDTTTVSLSASSQRRGRRRHRLHRVADERGADPGQRDVEQWRDDRDRGGREHRFGQRARHRATTC